jgi:hypothetical protein
MLKILIYGEEKHDRALRMEGILTPEKSDERETAGK